MLAPLVQQNLAYGAASVVSAQQLADVTQTATVATEDHASATSTLTDATQTATAATQAHATSAATLGDVTQTATAVHGTGVTANVTSSTVLDDVRGTSTAGSDKLTTAVAAHAALVICRAADPLITASHTTWLAIASSPTMPLINSRTRVDVAFRNASGALYDPTVVKLAARGCGLNVTYVYGVDASVVRDGVGLYHAIFLVTQPGQLHYLWASLSGGEEAMAEGSINFSAPTLRTFG